MPAHLFEYGVGNRCFADKPRVVLCNRAHLGVPVHSLQPADMLFCHGDSLAQARVFAVLNRRSAARSHSTLKGRRSRSVARTTLAMGTRPRRRPDVPPDALE